MSDTRINSSIVALLTLSLETLTRQLEAREEYDGDLMERLKEAVDGLSDELAEALIREWDAKLEGTA